MTRILPIATGVVALVACGVVHGLWTDRWAVKADAAAAAARLDALPMTVGDWEGEALSVSPRETQGLAGYVARRYVNRSTGDAVTLALMCGRPRVVSIHTPDACYAGRGYEVAEPAKFSPPSPADPAEFWTTDMLLNRAAEQSRLRVFYAWSDGGDWQAPDTPRVTFAGTNVLYKLYLLRDLPSGGAPPSDDPCLDFFRSLQPKLCQCLAPTPAG